MEAGITNPSRLRLRLALPFPISKNLKSAFFDEAIRIFACHLEQPHCLWPLHFAKGTNGSFPDAGCAMRQAKGEEGQYVF